MADLSNKAEDVFDNAKDKVNEFKGRAKQFSSDKKSEAEPNDGATAEQSQE